MLSRLWIQTRLEAVWVSFKVDQLVVVVNMARLLLLLVAGALGWSPRLAPSRRIFLERLRYPVAALATTGPLRALAVDPNVTSLQARAPRRGARARAFRPLGPRSRSHGEGSLARAGFR